MLPVGAGRKLPSVTRPFVLRPGGQSGWSRAAPSRSRFDRRLHPNTRCRALAAAVPLGHSRRDRRALGRSGSSGWSTADIEESVKPVDAAWRADNVPRAARSMDSVRGTGGTGPAPRSGPVPTIDDCCAGSVRTRAVRRRPEPRACQRRRLRNGRVRWVMQRGRRGRCPPGVQQAPLARRSEIRRALSTVLYLNQASMDVTVSEARGADRRPVDGLIEPRRRPRLLRGADRGCRTAGRCCTVGGRDRGPDSAKGRRAGAPGGAAQ